MNFHDTRRGQIFFDVQMPELIKSINGLTSEMKRMNDFSILNNEEKGLLRNPYKAEIELKDGKKYLGEVIACKENEMVLDDGIEFIKIPYTDLGFIKVIH